MKAAFGVEAIGLGASDRIVARHAGVRFRETQPWLAKITGPCERYGYQRTFLRARTDYSQSNSVGSRGIWLWWTLDADRLYQARYRTSWALSSWREMFLTVTGEGEVVELSAEEMRGRVAKIGARRAMPAALTARIARYVGGADGPVRR